MSNFDLHQLHRTYNTTDLKGLLGQLLKECPEYATQTIVTYTVRDTGETRLMACRSRDEVRQVFLSPHCTDARTVRAADPVEESDAA